MAARVSVIVPLYNVSAYVGECVESLLAQTMRDFEVVCVDDGSTDDSLMRAIAAASGDGRFIFLKQPNGGLSAARNTGLAHATGDYVVFLDSDDRYAPHALERLLAAADADDLDLVDFSASTFYESDEQRLAHDEDYYEHRPSIKGVMSGPELFVQHQRKRSYVSSACMHFIRLRALNAAQLRFGEGLLHEDELFTPLLYAVMGNSAFVNEPLYQRRMRAGSIMTAQRGVRNINSVLRIMQVLHAWLIEHARVYDGAFVDAFAMNMAYLGSYMYHDVRALDPDELESYVDSLDYQDRIAFNLLIRYASEPSEERADARCREILESRTFQVGKIATAGPRALRDLATRLRDRG